MLQRLRGKLIEKDYTKILVETGGGLGLRLQTPLTTALSLPDIGTEVTLHTRLILREESVELFGFLTKLERESFDVLTSVSRIGPRLAITIISALEPGELAEALVNQDISKLSSIKGIGVKTAERILVELKDKAPRLLNLQKRESGEATTEHVTKTVTVASEASLALQSLGYTKAEADKALKSISAKTSSDMSLEELIRESLKALQ
jgi:Holliday junction DNA helicase RuvA